jgi:hypothetical protein
MKIGRLCLVIFALTTATLSAAPHKGGSALQTKAAGGYWFYCYAEPDVEYDCDGSACGCRAACEIICEGPCDWDDTCPNEQ